MRLVFTIATIFVLALSTIAQTATPRFKKGESYKSVRIKMIKAGWSPFRSPDADACGEGDKRCLGRPEMYSCAGTGMANCSFVWKKGSKFLMILTVGEIAVYSGQRNGRP